MSVPPTPGSASQKALFSTLVALTLSPSRGSFPGTRMRGAPWPGAVLSTLWTFAPFTLLGVSGGRYITVVTLFLLMKKQHREAQLLARSLLATPLCCPAYLC